MKDKILDTLTELGFKLEVIDNIGYGFSYEGIKYMYMHPHNDENFLNICIPAVFDLEDDSDLMYYKLMDRINTNQKYVKAYELGNCIWLFYERELYGDEDLMVLITRMILHLEASHGMARRTFDELNSNAEENDEDNETVEPNEE